MAKYANGKYQIINTEKYIGKRLPTYRSSWEFTFMSFCDNNPSIINWASEAITIPYRNPVTGKNTVYIPDFLVVYLDANQQRHTELIEIKPSKETTMEAAKSYRDKLSVAINMAKWAMADQWAKAHGMRFRVVSEFDIFKNVKRQTTKQFTMTQKLQELFNLAPTEEPTVEEAKHVIEENTAILADVDLAIDKIDAALPYVNDIDTTDKELDELADLATDKFKDLMDLGMNVEARFSGTILQTAGTLLGHAITARQAKMDRKMRTIDLQLKKMRLDQQAAKDGIKTDGEKLAEAADGNGVVLDRNALLAQILGKSKPD